MKKPKAPRLVTVAITTTITVIFWIFFTLYQVLTTKPPSSVAPELLAPIDPTLDTNSLSELKNRVYFEEGSFIPLKTVTNADQFITEAPEEPEEETTVENPPEGSESDGETIAPIENQ